MPEEDAGETEDQEEERQESIEDLFKPGAGADGDGGQNGAEKDPAETAPGEDDEADERPADVEEDDSSDDEAEGDEPEEDAPVVDPEDEPPDVVDDGPVGSGVDDDLIALEDRTEPPELVAGGATGGRLSTGIETLDERLGGGIPQGRILSFVATADTQSELLVKHLAARHDCLYLSTLRPKWEVEEEVRDFVQKSGANTGGTSVHIEQLTPDSRLDSARREVEKLDGPSIVVVDSANELEAMEKERYVYFMDDLKRKLWETGSVGLFYCIEEEEPQVGRDVTLRRADLIWQLRAADEPAEHRHRLVVSKFRGGRALAEPLNLTLTDEVVVEADPGGG